MLTPVLSGYDMHRLFKASSSLAAVEGLADVGEMVYASSLSRRD